MDNLKFWWMNVKIPLHELRYYLFDFCPDCKRILTVLWWWIGDHSECVPF